MQFNEFNRRLESCHLDEETKFLLTHMFEVQMEFSKELDKAMSVLVALAETVQNITTLHESTQQRVKALTQERHAEVRSVKGEDF